eukprot:424215-Prymnesium_polylepis.3
MRSQLAAVRQGPPRARASPLHMLPVPYLNDAGLTAAGVPRATTWHARSAHGSAHLARRIPS